jgi:hypothetical protein
VEVHHVVERQLVNMIAKCFWSINQYRDRELTSARLVAIRMVASAASVWPCILKDTWYADDLHGIHHTIFIV